MDFKKSIHKFIIKYLDSKNLLHFHKTPLYKKQLLLHQTVTFSYKSQANMSTINDTAAAQWQAER